MILFPNAKINLGLQVLNRRKDGFHNINSIFYPVPFRDVIEFHPAESYAIQAHGTPLQINHEGNLVTRIWKSLSQIRKLPPIEIHLLKNIPPGSGLGAGSSNASHFLRVVNEFFSLDLSSEEMLELTLKTGSDCPYFLHDRPALVNGRGEIVKPITLSLKDKWLMIIFHPEGISTARAFSAIQPGNTKIDLEQLIAQPIHRWKEILKNDFEKVVFSWLPELGQNKRLLYELGAEFASLTGTGSAVYGIFDEQPQIDPTQEYPDFKLLQLS